MPTPKFHEKSKRRFQNGFRLFLSLLVILLLPAIVFAATFDWLQTTWTGGASTDVANHTDNQANWNKYYSKDDNVLAGDNLTLSQTTETNTETTDADFNAGTKDTVYVSGNSVYLSKPLGASCSANAECDDNDCVDSVCVYPWISGTCSDIEVYKMDVSGTKQWKTTGTSCDTPQCGVDGAQNGDELVADNTVDFSLYPARNACKDLGGRLPTKTELGCIYTNKSEYGSFPSIYYWSSTEYSTTSAYRQSFTDGNVGIYSKTDRYYVRCVRGQ